MQQPQNPVAALKDDLSKSEEETNYALTTVVSDSKNDLGHLESPLTALHNKTNKCLDTEIGSLSNDLVALTSRVAKVHDDLAKLYSALNGRTETFSTPDGTQDQILSRLDCFSTAHAQVETRLTLLEALPASSICPASQPIHPAVHAPPPSSPTASAAPLVISDITLPHYLKSQIFVPSLPRPGGSGECSVPGLQLLETDIDAFSTVIDYRCYRLTNRVT